MTRRVSRGFTLIELLTVIAIISILASMLFPSFAKARAKAEAIDCISNLSNLGKAIQMYSSDYDSLAPGHDKTTWVDGSANPARFGYCVDGWASPGAKTNWAQAIQPYVKNYQIYQCKSTLDNAPGADPSGQPISYILNGCCAGRLLDAAPKPAETALLYDWCWDFTWATMNPVPAAGGTYQVFFKNDTSTHDEQYNVLYCDGHAKTIPASRMAFEMVNGASVGNLFYW